MAVAAHQNRSARALTDLAQIVGLKYDGSGDIECLFRKIESVCRVYPGQEDHKLGLLWLQLDGKALQHAERQPEETKDSYDLLKQALLTQYGDPRVESDFVVELCVARQKANETVREFVSRLEELAHKATPSDLNEAQRGAMRNTYLLHSARTGLRPIIKEKLVTAEWASWQETKELIIRVGTRMEGEQPAEDRGPSFPRAPYRHPVRMQQPPRVLTCFTCGGQGHFRAACPNLARTGSGWQRPPNAPPQSRGVETQYSGANRYPAAGHPNF